MIESFTAGALRALERAGARALRRGATAVEPADLLAALADEPESRAAELLAEFGLDPLRVGHALGLAACVRGGARGARGRGHPPRSVALRAVLGDAAMQARALDRGQSVGTEHLLAGLVAAAGPVADLLAGAGLEPAALAERLTRAGAVETGPIPMAAEIPPLDLAEPGEGADLGRILDASANRAREGLRVAEDYVRFVLDDPGLTSRLKEVRHRLAESLRGLDPDLLLTARDTPGDVGTHIMTAAEQTRENPRAVLSANFKRTAEALRSLEEYSKLIDVWLSGRFEVLRYDVYTLEKLTLTAVAARRGLGDAAAPGPGRRPPHPRRPDLGRRRGPGRRGRRHPAPREGAHRPRMAPPRPRGPRPDGPGPRPLPHERPPRPGPARRRRRRPPRPATT